MVERIFQPQAHGRLGHIQRLVQVLALGDAAGQVGEGNGVGPVVLVVVEQRGVHIARIHAISLLSQQTRGPQNTLCGVFVQFPVAGHRNGTAAFLCVDGVAAVVSFLLVSGGFQLPNQVAPLHEIPPDKTIILRLFGIVNTEFT